MDRDPLPREELPVDPDSPVGRGCRDGSRVREGRPQRPRRRHGREIGTRVLAGQAWNYVRGATNASSRALRRWSIEHRSREALMRRVIRKAAEVVTVSAGRYRELA